MKNHNADTGIPKVSMSTIAKAQELLGNGTPEAQVALACGVTAGYISQLMSDPEFSAKVNELRYINLANASKRDAAYDELEDELLKKMKELLPYYSKPREVLSAINVINGAKRRGAQTAGGGPELKADRAVLSIPQVIKQQFILNVQNQVIQVGDTGLETISAGALNARIQEAAISASIESQRTSIEHNSMIKPTPHMKELENHEQNAARRTDETTEHQAA